jgi:hypothetical protein
MLEALPGPSAPHRPRSRLLVAACSACVVLATGCGGGDGGGGGGAGDFTGEAKKICSKAGKRILAAADGESAGETPGGRPTRIRAEATAALRRLTPPADKHTAFENLLAARDREVALYRAAQGIADDDLAARSASNRETLGTLRRAAELAEALGVPNCAL